MIINFIKRMLGVRRGGQPVQLFSGCGVYSQTLEHTSTLVILVTACFSKQVPSIIIERWGKSTVPCKLRTQRRSARVQLRTGERFTPQILTLELPTALLRI